MRKVAAAPGGGADKYEYFFQVGANSKDEITLECGSFDMKGIMCMANETASLKVPQIESNSKAQMQKLEAMVASVLKVP